MPPCPVEKGCSSVRLQPCDTGRSVRKAACRTRLRLRWCSSCSRGPRKAGVGSMGPSNCQKCWKEYSSLTESRSSDHKRKPPPDPFRHQHLAIAPRLKALYGLAEFVQELRGLEEK